MKDKTIKFYVNKFVYLKSDEEIDVSFLPPIVKRRLSKFDKCVLSILKKAYDEDIQNIVFSSQYGEVERLLKLISQYQEEKEVSPNVFSGSVHNYPVGFFLLNEKKSVPYTALAGGVNSISSGLLASLVSDFENILYCYADIKNENVLGLALNISKNEKSNSKKFLLSLNQKSSCADVFDDYIKLFCNQSLSIETKYGKIMRDEN